MCPLTVDHGVLNYEQGIPFQIKTNITVSRFGCGMLHRPLLGLQSLAVFGEDADCDLTSRNEWLGTSLEGAAHFWLLLSHSPNTKRP